MFQEYKIIFLYALVCLLVVCVLLIACYLFSYSTQSRAENFEKVSAYECGFEPFEEARLPFDIHYYMVAILFLIFDLEIAFLFPWAVSFGLIGFSNWYVMVFVIILTLGFIFEWKMGALTWVKVTKKTDDIDISFRNFKNLSV